MKHVSLHKLRSISSEGGYSMMELVVYIALFVLISVVLINALTTVMRTYASAVRYRTVQNNGNLVMERITRELREGKSATTSACATTPGTVSIASIDAASVAHTNTFSVANGTVQLTTDGGAATNLSTSEVTVTSLTFCPITLAAGSAVKTTLVLTTTGNTPYSTTFYSTIVLRGT
jgi:hypothetical protein